ncbi:hypothetical protein BFW38_15645 [Terasakiispira papahanaumokuakeensis]|uniref:Cell division protein ZapA n=1 Tax=Terasakiispira papahanaumokuakeensis TaxID=197479 RepID=A0A1E2VCM5_9GAMM|nr:cell division protein ZapA [Terasakiispira papahanaumokuakeensis]ODC04749.1 hypothetical protein BFW38_15645 [Terasakiispira papahanaumokuakeensis]
MTQDRQTLEITLLDRKYMVACPPEEQEQLLQAARYLNRKMLDIRRGGKVLSLERVAIMAALNITHEMMQQGSRAEQSNEVHTEQLSRMSDQLDDALLDLKQVIQSHPLPSDPD